MEVASSTAAGGCLVEKAASGVEYFKCFSSYGSRIKSKSLFVILDSGTAALTDTHSKNSVRNTKSKKKKKISHILLSGNRSKVHIVRPLIQKNLGQISIEKAFRKLE